MRVLDPPFKTKNAHVGHLLSSAKNILGLKTETKRNF